MTILELANCKHETQSTELDRLEMVGGNLPLVSNNLSSIAGIWSSDAVMIKSQTRFDFFLARLSFSHHENLMCLRLRSFTFSPGRSVVPVEEVASVRS